MKIGSDKSIRVGSRSRASDLLSKSKEGTRGIHYLRVDSDERNASVLQVNETV